MGKNPNTEFVSHLEKRKGIIFSSHGEIIIDLRTGKVKQILPDDPYNDDNMKWAKWAESVSRFDLEEFHNHYGCDEQETNFDILDLGYWVNRKFQPADESFREETSTL